MSDSLKVGLLTPIFKNKGEKTIFSNYRGINKKKYSEIGYSQRSKKHKILVNVVSQQTKTSPLNSALILEEIVREYKDSGESVYFIFLGAKSAFDVVDHKHLMRHLYHIGVQDKHCH